MSSQTQVENVQQKIEGVAQEVSEVKASLSAAKQAGDGDEVSFLRTQLLQLREEKNLLLQAQQGGGRCSLLPLLAHVQLCDLSIICGSRFCCDLTAYLTGTVLQQ